MAESDKRSGIAIGALVAIVLGIFSQTTLAKQEQVIISNQGQEGIADVNPVIPCSYVIFLDGPNTDAKNCMTGVIQFKSTNSSNVINQAINSTTASQLILVKKGLYKLTAPIELQHGLTLVGEGAGQNVTNGSQGTHFWVASGRNINAMEYTKNYLGYFITIREVFIDGNYKNNLVGGNGIYLNVNASDFLLENSYIDGFRNNCFLADSAFNDRFIGATFEHCQNDGMFIKAGTDVYVAGDKALTNNNRGFEFGTGNGGPVELMFLGNYVAGNGNNNFISFNTPSMVMQGNTFEEVSNVPLNFHAVLENNCANSEIIGNIFTQNGATMNGAVDITHASCTNASVLSNNIHGTYTNAIQNSGTGTIIRFNVGFKTENSGTATIASASTSIAVTHGLAYTPSINDITVTPQGSWGSCSQWWISNPTSTQFTINCNVAPTASNLNFTWKVTRT